MSQSPPLDFHVISDTHFYDDRLVGFLGRPPDFEDVIIDNWIKTVDEDDVILHMGDLVLPDHAEVFKAEIAPKLTGKKYLIKGNYDTLPDEFYESCGFTVIEPFSIQYGEWEVFFSHYPKAGLDLTKQVNVHGHIHNTQVDHTTRNHYNVCVEVRNYTPWFTGQFMEHMIFRAGAATIDRDFDPNDVHSKVFRAARRTLHAVREIPDTLPEGTSW